MVHSVHLQRLRRNFEILEMKEGDTITEYVSRVMVVANDMKNLGEIMPDAKVVEKILRTLIEKFTYVVCVIEESNDIKSLTVDGLQSSLLVHESNMRKYVREEHALKVEGQTNMKVEEAEEDIKAKEEADTKVEVVEAEEVQALTRAWWSATSVIRWDT